MSRVVGRRPSTAVVLFLTSSLVGLVLGGVVASGRPILASRWTLLAELGVWGLAWLVAVIAALHLPARRWLVLVLGAGLALRLAAMAGPPTTSDDLYRYSWDGKVQAAGIDPYAAAPAGPDLARLRDGWLWPDPAGCAALERPPGCSRINRPAARTIYPPVAESWFAGVYRIAGIGAHHKAWQGAGLATEVGVLLLMPVALRRWGRDPRWTALYALCPAPVLEIVNNGHVDGLAILLTVAAFVVAVPPPGRDPTANMAWRDVAAGALIAAAALVKVYPAVFLVALVGVGRDRRGLILLRAGATAAVVATIAYLPHVVAVGAKVLGYLPGYLKEEHYRTGSRFLVAGALHIPPPWAAPVSALALAVVVLWVLVRRPAVPAGAAALMGALLLATSPVQPWYAVSLLALAAVAARPRWAAIVIAGYPFFFAVILAYRHTAGLGQLCYCAACFVVIGIAGLVARRRRGATTGERNRDWAAQVG